MISARTLAFSAAGCTAMLMLTQAGSSFFGQAGEFPGTLTMETNLFDTAKGTGFQFQAEQIRQTGQPDDTPKIIVVSRVVLNGTFTPSPMQFEIHTNDGDRLKFVSGGLCNNANGLDCENTCTEEKIQDTLHKVTCLAQFTPQVMGGRVIDWKFFRVVYEAVKSEDPEDDGCHDRREGKNPQSWRELQLGINASTTAGAWDNNQQIWHPYECLQFTNSGGGGGGGGEGDASDDEPCDPDGTSPVSTQ